MSSVLHLYGGVIWLPPFPGFSFLSIFIGAWRTTSLSNSGKLNHCTLLASSSCEETLLSGRILWPKPLAPTSSKSQSCFSRLAFKVSPGRGFCDWASEEVWKAYYLHGLAEYYTGFPVSMAMVGTLLQAMVGRSRQFLKFPDHTSASHSPANTVPVCSLYLLFGSPDLVTLMSDTCGDR